MRNTFQLPINQKMQIGPLSLSLSFSSPLQLTGVDAKYRMTLAYFCLSSLALLPDPTTSSSDEGPPRRAIETMLTPKQRNGFIDWIYQQQLPSGGFRGSDSLDGLELERANIIQSYTALLNLAILDDGLERLDRKGMIRFVGECQVEDGS